MASKLDLSADRWVMFRRTFAFVGYDFTGAAFKMEIRAIRDTGAALVSLTTQTTDVQGVRLVYGGSDTIANHLAAGRLSQDDVAVLLDTENPATGVDYVTGDTIALSQVGVRIDKATMSALPLPSTVGNDLALYWDIHITPSGGDEQNFAGGIFTVVAGVTQ